MPLIKRSVEPRNVSRGPGIASGVTSVQDELEFVCVSTLANVMRQLSSLSVRVDDMFGELNRESVAISRRTVALTERTERLRMKIMQLNPTVEPVLLQDINTRKPFKSSVIKDQQVISLVTRPLAIAETYHCAEPPPALQKLNPYRQDGKDSLKFYTEPGYFFELWCQAMQKDAARNQQKRQRKARRSPYSAPAAEEEEGAGRGQQQKHQHWPAGVETPATNVATKQDMITSSDVDGVLVQRSVLSNDYVMVQQMHSSAVNKHSQLQPSRPELHDSGTGHHQNGLPESSAGCNPAATQPPTSSSSITVSAVAGNDSTTTKTGVTRPQCGTGNSIAEVNGNAQSSSSSVSTSAAGNSSVQLPSPPPTPPTAKSRLTDSRPSPARVGFSSEQCQNSRKNSTPDSIELPLPPSPPLEFCQSSSLDSPGGVLPPPPLDDSLYTIPPRVSPPPPMSPVSSAAADLITSAAAGKIIAKSSEVSTFVVEPAAASLVDGLSVLADVMSGFEGEMQDRCEVAASDQPLVRDTRSDLLAAIREGIQLRKVEERRLKSAQKHRQPTHLDVQSLMEAAFELRRKALEDNDSDFDDGTDDHDELSGNWSDVN